MKSKKLGIFIFVVFLILAAIFLFLKFVKITLRPAAELRTSTEPKIIIKKTPIIGRRGTEKLWELFADSIKVSKDGTQTTLSGLRWGKIYQNNKPIVFFSARETQLDSMTNNLQITGEVKMQYRKEKQVLSLRTDRIYWLSGEEILVCPGEVELKIGQMLLKTPKLLYRAKESKIECPRGIVGTLEENRGWLWSDRLWGDLLQEEFHLEGHVRMRLRIQESEGLIPKIIKR